MSLIHQTWSVSLVNSAVSHFTNIVGCPLSPYLFILCAEILGNKVRKDNEVHGIKSFDTESKLSQCADDTSMILDGSKSSFFEVSVLT